MPLVGLFAALMAATGGDGDRATVPAAVRPVLAAVPVVAVLTAIAARLGGRRQVVEMLQAEFARHLYVPFR